MIHVEGRDLTIVAIGSMVATAIKAAKALAEDGIAAEVVDPRWLAPLDSELILGSLARTGRLLIADEARDACSAASQIAAVAADRGFAHLRAPVRRVTVPDIAIPYSPPLEQALLPNAETIAAAAKSLLAEGPHA